MMDELPFLSVFLPSCFFLWAYMNVAEHWSRRAKGQDGMPMRRVWGWVLVLAGVVFSLLHTLTAAYLFDLQDPVGSLFVWFCFSGIFAVASCHLAWRTLRVLRATDVGQN